MAFGQVSGPPATARRVAELLALLEQRGFESFREARHPFGLTQRQAAGKFSVAEADGLIERLEAEAEASGVSGAAPAETASVGSVDRPTVAAERSARRRRQRDEEAAVHLDAEVMATELVNRGWCCIPPA